FACDIALPRSGQGCEAGTFGELVLVFREVPAKRGEIVFLTRHGIAQNDGSAIRIQRALRETLVFESFPRTGDGPLLSLSHGVYHTRRHSEAPLHGFPGILSHPSAD